MGYIGRKKKQENQENNNNFKEIIIKRGDFTNSNGRFQLQKAILGDTQDFEVDIATFIAEIASINEIDEEVIYCLFSDE